MPFGQAARLLASFTHTRVSESTAQRQTEAIGSAYETVQLAEVERIECDWPEVEPGPAKLLLSADGAMVPLVGGAWAEVKTVVVSEVSEPVVRDGTAKVATHTPSYFSRLTDVETFQRRSLGELTRRRLETAGQVAAVNDGAEWIQGFVDYHCSEAIRILDFAHAAERICQIGDVVLGEGTATSAAWRTEQLHQLKHEGANDLIPARRTFAAGHLRMPMVNEHLAYLEKRVTQMQYGVFQAQGWPIGSGPVASGNKLVVAARLKGAGMHWARASVNPLLSLRNAVCNDPWEEAWRESAAQIRKQGRQQPRLTPRQPSVPLPPTIPAAVELSSEPSPPTSPKPVHPWRRFNTATRANLSKAKL